MLPVIVSTAYCVAAIASLSLTRGVDGLAAIWPSSGIAVAGMILARKGQRRWIALAVAIASMTANTIMGSPLLTSLGLTCANVTEPIIAWLLMRRIGSHQDSLYNLTSVARFCFAAVTAGVASGLVSSLATGQYSDEFALSWISTVSLGIMIVTPAILSFVRSPAAAHGASGEGRGKTVLTALAVLIVTLLVFGQSSYPVLYLPLAAVIFATYLQGARGATYSVLLIAVVGSVSTWLNIGPIPLLKAPNQASAILFFQFYLLTLLLSAMPLAALLNTRQRHYEQIARTMRWLELSERFSKVGHWRLELQSGQLYWSDEVFRIHGLSEHGPLPLVEDAINFYHPDDRAMVQDFVTALIADHVPFEFDARILRVDGGLRHVHSRGEIECDEGGRPIAIFGIFQDVTDRVLATMQIAEAQRVAESEAQRANELAQTDPLTGIANRRRSITVLEEEFERARDSATPLAVGILDIDHFKSVNDTFGHAVGDIVIRTVAQTCRQILRGTDLVGRIGGEEFVLVLPGALLPVASMSVERLRLAIAAIDWAPLQVGPVTVSIGLAALNAQGDCYELLQEADRALYEAKQAGRNRMCLAA
ncbi:sensor domain-containing diguanylate cyclase [Novosphingobium sp. 9]|uniref:sensor domain-containing diguanylate cyclase n=1 Tax=Novosphingobium sp. 9 TaxID=2025349 RepID=UPI0021B6266B|nr:sensor domain-containing diguanylate cyclase [Novosphingobium sp. 9]